MFSLRAWSVRGLWDISVEKTSREFGINDGLKVERDGRGLVLLKWAHDGEGETPCRRGEASPALE